MELVLKTSDSERNRGFESLLLRHHIAVENKADFKKTALTI